MKTTTLMFNRCHMDVWSITQQQSLQLKVGVWKRLGEGGYGTVMYNGKVTLGEGLSVQ